MWEIFAIFAADCNVFSMANRYELLRRLRDRVGLEMKCSADFDVLAQAISDSTHERLGVNTLKRLFGFNAPMSDPRSSTMDVLARYLGFSSYEALCKTMGEDADISEFAPIDCINVRSLKRSTVVRICYEPNRTFALLYMGDCVFTVLEAEGSRNIQVGDVLTITQLAVGHRLVVEQVLRFGENLGAYEAAKFQGLTSVEVIE